jgi:hypothetical protein
MATVTIPAGTYSSPVSQDAADEAARQAACDAAGAYTGCPEKGVYLWGALVAQTSLVGRRGNIVAFEQVGEDAIEAVFNVYANSPMNIQVPCPLRHEMTAQGVQIIAGEQQSQYYVNGVAQNSLSGTAINPVYLYYRKQCPEFSADDYDASATYDVGDQIYFTDSRSKGNFWKCTEDTTAGQSPDTNPELWEVLPIPASLFQSIVYQAFSDWLISDGQMEKSIGAKVISDRKLDEVFDRNQRQMGQQMPMLVSTHVSSRRSY